MWKKITFIGFLLTAVLTGDSNLLGHTLEQIQAVEETENLLVNPIKKLVKKPKSLLSLE
jgi:hypothetical protein